MAKVEPIVKYKITRKAVPAHLGKSFVNSSPRPKIETITNVIKGIKTPVNTNPKEALAQLYPAVKPSIGGKIIFPAPKNKAKIIIPKTIISLRENIISNPKIERSAFYNNLLQCT